MKKNKFVPSADQLESRIALSGATPFVSGVPVLTTQTLNRTYAAIHSAYVKFATHSPLRYYLLQANLGTAVSKIPFNVRDGLLAEVQGEVPVLHTSIKTGVVHPVIKSWQSTVADVKNFVTQEVNAGLIILR